jgi:hypothetical protein
MRRAIPVTVALVVGLASALLAAGLASAGVEETPVKDATARATLSTIHSDLTDGSLRGTVLIGPTGNSVSQGTPGPAASPWPVAPLAPYPTVETTIYLTGATETTALPAVAGTCLDITHWSSTNHSTTNLSVLIRPVPSSTPPARNPYLIATGGGIVENLGLRPIPQPSPSLAVSAQLSTTPSGGDAKVDVFIQAQKRPCP